MSLPVKPRSSKYPSRVWERKLGRVEDRREEVGYIWNVAVERQLLVDQPFQLLMKMQRSVLELNFERFSSLSRSCD